MLTAPGGQPGPLPIRPCHKGGWAAPALRFVPLELGSLWAPGRMGSSSSRTGLAAGVTWRLEQASMLPAQEPGAGGASSWNSQGRPGWGLEEELCNQPGQQPENGEGSRPKL